MNISQGEVISERTFDDGLEPVLRRVPRSNLRFVMAAKVEGASVFVGPLGKFTSLPSESFTRSIH